MMMKFSIKDIIVIHEDNHLIAVNKPSGILVHSDQTGDETLADLVKQYIKIRYGKPGDVFLGVIHRIDRPVSGVVIFARTTKALTRMNLMLQKREITKTYLAIVQNRPPELNDTISHHLLKNTETNIVKAYTKAKPGTKKATLSYQLVGQLDDKTLLKVSPETGRPHQIRAQLSKIGAPIIGDLKYGAHYPIFNKSIALHCLQMSFNHPVQNDFITIQAQAPHHLPWDTFDCNALLSDDKPIFDK